mmetsp:Transcript_946/g.1856  ORF Transcript_946/g.1856 Transcript_946/m.1856 type:complete len:136 (+) Transcript_946:232-639(+)
MVSRARRTSGNAPSCGTGTDALYRRSAVLAAWARPAKISRFQRPPQYCAGHASLETDAIVEEALQARTAMFSDPGGRRRISRTGRWRRGCAVAAVRRILASASSLDGKRNSSQVSHWIHENCWNGNTNPQKNLKN